MQLTGNIFLHCSSLGEVLLREGGPRFYPALSSTLNAPSSSVLLLSIEYEMKDCLFWYVKLIDFF